MEAFARWLVRWPLAVVVANLLVTLALGAYALHIRIESSLESVLPAGDPKIAYYEEVRRLFGSDDVGVIGVLADDIFAPGTIEKIARVTNELAKIDGLDTLRAAIDKLRAEMRQAAADLEFERAALLRDKARELEQIELQMR